METKLNIIEILKDKSQGTKLYSLTYGDCFYQEYTGDFGIECQSQNGVQFNLDEYGRCCIDGECILFPSKSMRDWSKFAWKKGDVLVSNDGDSPIIFKGFSSDDYTTFEGKHWISVSKKRHVSCLNMQNTQDYHIENNKEAAQTYINTIEGKLGGKLNLKTLEIERTLPEFKNGDILCVIDNSNNYHYILIYKGHDDKHIYRYVTMFLDGHLNFDDGAYLTKPKDYFIRYTTYKEKQQLFDALAKEGKAWDSKKKEIVDLKEKVELKPFDKVLVRDNKSDSWRANLFSHINNDGHYNCMSCTWTYCIPYEGNESLVGTTKDVEG